MIKLNDISRWQDDVSTAQHVDFKKMIAAGSKGVFIKVSQSTWVDRDYVMNWANSHSLLPRSGYHFLTWDATPKDQARIFAGALKQEQGEINQVMDYECRTGVPYQSVAIKRAKIFSEEVEQILGRKNIIYTSPSYWKEFGDPNDLYWYERKLWIANYYVTKPSVPAPWIDWTLWQQGEGKGEGLAHGAESLDIDMDYYDGDWAQFAAEFGITMPEPGTTTESIEPEPVETGALRYRVLDGMNIRSTPSAAGTYSIVGKLAKGTIIEVTDIAGLDAWVKMPDGNYACYQTAGKRYLERVE